MKEMNGGNLKNRDTFVPCVEGWGPTSLTSKPSAFACFIKKVMRKTTLSGTYLEGICYQ